ncbi:MAG: DotI/IcmL family type IV secretion protein [Pseudomonadota bacterium]
MDEKQKREHSSELTVPVPLFSNFYQDQYRRAVFATAFATLTNLICVFLIIFLLLQKPIDIYVPAEEVAPQVPASLAISNYAITPKISIDKANFGNEEINQWLLKTVIQLFTYNLQDYPRELQKNQAYFIPEAQNQYLSILNDLAHFGEYTTKDVVVSTIFPRGAPAIYDQGIINGRYSWAFDFPVEVQFSGSISIPSQTMTLRIVVVRTSMENDVDGIKIAAISASDIRRSGVLASA